MNRKSRDPKKGDRVKMQRRGFFFAILVIIFQPGCYQPSSHFSESRPKAVISPSSVEDDFELFFKRFREQSFTCMRATIQQIGIINSGTKKLNQFLSKCYSLTNSSHWCDELVRPNPNSHSIFDCTYSAAQAHYLIHPDEITWTYAFTAVQLVQELEQKGLRVCEIYNWWRPEPYNKNVGGAPGRHPYGTSVDVRFCSNNDANRAFDELCKIRRAGRLRAIGHYGTSALHFGIGDRVANTWGRNCP